MILNNKSITPLTPLFIILTGQNKYIIHLFIITNQINLSK